MIVLGADGEGVAQELRSKPCLEDLALSPFDNEKSITGRP